MKTSTLLCISLFMFLGLAAQTVKPCNAWLTGYIQADPKMSDGTAIDKYLLSKLQSDSTLQSEATCMVGLLVSVNCNGEFSYESQNYRNNPALAVQCKDLLQRTEGIMSSVKSLLPGKVGGHNEDFVFKLVVIVNKKGKAVTELLY